MTRVDRIKRRLEKEDAEREVAYQKAAPERAKRHKEIDTLLAEYDVERKREPYTVSDRAREIWRHLVDEYQYDLVALYRRWSEGKSL